MMQLTLSQWGLVLDIIGVLLIFAFGLPSPIVDEIGDSIVSGHNPKELPGIRRRNQIVRIGGYSGLTLVVVGFILQFLGSTP